MFNEKEVISRIISGETTAFTLLVRQYEHLVFHVINRLIDTKEDTEDVCQEVFISVYRGLPGFGFQSRLSTWIARIAYHTAINYLRKHKKAGTTTSPEYMEQHHFTLETPHDATAKKDVSAYIHQLIEQLPEQYKTVLTLYHLNEFSYLEIEEITGMPEGTVKSYLFRARKLLKEKLEVHLKNELV
jgi:RNA polymerase sigma factor (sigma-70 family)